ncbi:MAG: patatin-like phospholipase family protein [Sneathiella sp.]
MINLFEFLFIYFKKIGFRGAPLIVFTLILAGCSSIPDRNPLSSAQTQLAGIPGVPDARFWADEWPKYSIEIFETYTEADFLKHFPAMYKQSHNYLAISGGGSNGAYGAGLLLGWTAAGTRPEFSMVTGISTGSLTAPFAFLGSDYDDDLKKVYTTTKTSDIATKRWFLASLFSDSLADTTPLKSLIAQYITPELVDAIGREHKRGRRLFIGTMNLDAGRSVIWNIGAIAISNYPKKLNLIREVLRASAAIPIAFPPVIIPVEVNGITYDELHVDGGTGSQVFVYPAAIDFKGITKKLQVPDKPNVYVIRNAFLDADYAGVDRSLLPIASRTIDSLIRTQGVGDLYQILALCVRDDNIFNLAYIPSTFTEKPSEGFDPVYMNKLFDFGYERALKSYPWEHFPPGYVNYQHD